MRVFLTNLQQAQQAALIAAHAARAEGPLGAAIQAGLNEAFRRVVARTPVDTGSWRAAHRPHREGLRGWIDVPQGAKNIRSGTRVRVYAKALAGRNPSRYDVYALNASDTQAVTEAGARAFGAALESELP